MSVPFFIRKSEELLGLFDELENAAKIDVLGGLTYLVRARCSEVRSRGFVTSRDILSFRPTLQLALRMGLIPIKEIKTWSPGDWEIPDQAAS